MSRQGWSYPCSLADHPTHIADLPPLPIGTRHEHTIPHAHDSGHLPDCLPAFMVGSLSCEGRLAELREVSLSRPYLLYLHHCGCLWRLRICSASVAAKQAQKAVGSLESRLRASESESVFLRNEPGRFVYCCRSRPPKERGEQWSVYHRIFAFRLLHKVRST